MNAQVARPAPGAQTVDEARPTTWTTIAPSRGWRGLGLGDVWEYRTLLRAYIWREISSRYRQMALGPLWIVLIPLVNMFICTLVFSRGLEISTDDLPGPIFYFAALLPWQLFATSASGAAMSLVKNLHVISKVYFPRLLIPLSTVMVGVADFLVSLVILIVMMVCYRDRITISAAAFMLPAYIVMAAAAALAVGLWLAAIAVKFRDIGFGVDHIIRVCMFLTPVVYPVSVVAEIFPSWVTLYRLNPMTSVIEGFRWALLGKGHPPDLITLASAGIAFAALVTGAYVFRRTERTIVDLI